MTKKCWICETRDATTDEHVIMKAAFEKILGKIDKHDYRHFYYFNANKSIRLMSYKNQRLTFENIICSECNESITQPYDTAFLSFVEKLQSSKNLVISRNKISLARINQENFALYILKIFGCLLERNEQFLEERDRELFRNSLLRGRVLTNNLYISLHRDIDLIAKKNSQMFCSQPMFRRGWKSWAIQLDWISLVVSYPSYPSDKNVYGEPWNLKERKHSLNIGKRK